MERLTGRNEYGFAYYKHCFRENECRGQINREKCAFCKHEYNFCDKLAAYEDAEEQLIKAAGVDLQSMIGEFMHYYNLQKEGRIVELPCKVGDTVYEASRFWDSVIERNVAFVVICKNSIYVKNGCGDSFEFGKEVFLTREEAEAALERMG